MATPEQIRRRGRWSLALLTVLAAFIVVGVAAADQIDADADALATSPPQGNGVTANQQPGTTVEYDLSAAIDETGNATDDVFVNVGDKVDVTIARTGSWLASPAGSPASFTFTTYNTNQAGKIRIAVPCGTSAGTVRTMSAVLTAVASNEEDLSGTPTTLTWTITALGADASSCTPVNTTPTADAGGPYSVGEGGSVGLSGSGSDTDGDPLTYEWDLDNNGSFETLGQSPTFSAAGRDGPGSQTVVLRVCDDNGACATSSTTVTINNVAPTIASVTNSGPVDEGSAATITVNATDPAGVLDPLSYEFDCDDNGLYEITPQAANSASCTYADGPSSHTVNVRVTDGDGGADTDSTAVTVDNVEPTIAISGASNVNEGSLYSLTLGAVTDPGADTVTAYVVHWGDGSSDSYGTNGVKTHTYADGPNNWAITVDLTDEDDTFLDQANALSVTVDNVAPTIAISGASNVNEGSLYSLTLGAVTDPGTDTITAYVVHWGDGSSDSYGTNGVKTHTYADGPNNWAITVDLTDEDDTFLDQANALGVTVDNVKPAVTIDSLTGSGGVACIGGNQVTLGFSWTDPAASNDTYSYDVNWGDGSAHATGSSATSPVSGLTHSYVAGGPYTIVVTVNDEDPGAGGTKSSTAFSFLYSASGVLQPVNDTQAHNDPSVFKYGSTVPVKIRVTDCNGVTVSGLAPQIAVKKIAGSTPPSGIDETITSTSGADSGTTMRYSDGIYIYNLATKSLADSSATYEIRITGLFNTVTATFGTRAK
jgi:hypothetical protein